MIQMLAFIAAFTILFAAFNALVILWQQDINGKRLWYSKVWHGLGRVIIGLVIIYLWYFDVQDKSKWLIYGLTCFNLSWTIWDITINAIRKLNGTDIGWLHGHKGVNGIVFSVCFKNLYVYWVARFGLIVVNIYLLIKYF